MSELTARILIKGMVQMVGFRYFAVRYAQKLGIDGFVRNLPSGEVEVIARSDEDSMNEFIGLLKKGPASAVVKDAVISYNSELDENFTDFSVRY